MLEEDATCEDAAETDELNCNNSKDEEKEIRHMLVSNHTPDRFRSLAVQENKSGADEASVHSVCLMEVAPEDSGFHGNSWKIPLSEFTNRKSSVSFTPKDTRRLSRRIRKYYKRQDELISEFEEMEGKIKDLEDEDVDDNDNARKYAARLSQLSFAVNLVLLVSKAVAVGLSGSISVISSLVDSGVDLLSGIIIWYTSRAVKRFNLYLYPTGRSRLEPLAIVILSVIMSVASIQIIIESIQKIAGLVSDKSIAPYFELPTIIITSSTVGIKLTLFLVCFFINRKYKLKSGSVSALMMDHRNDTISNAVALICGYLGSKEFVLKTGKDNVVFIDPIGAIIIGFYILIGWWKTGLEQIKMLTGHTAKPQFLSKITWICLNHNCKITKIDTVRAFHFGNQFLVEVDIVLPKDMTLEATHQIGESLQQKLEKLREVERAFVHVDWETEHRPQEEHRI